MQTCWNIALVAAVLGGIAIMTKVPNPDIQCQLFPIRCWNETEREEERTLWIPVMEFNCRNKCAMKDLRLEPNWTCTAECIQQSPLFRLNPQRIEECKRDILTRCTDIHNQCLFVDRQFIWVCDRNHKKCIEELKRCV
jgi:hypothetical protein